MAMYKVVCCGVHLFKMKSKYNCGDRFKAQEVDLKKIVKNLKAGGLDESNLMEFGNKQDQDDDDDDMLIASVSPLDMKIKKELAQKSNAEKKRKARLRN